MSVTIGAHVVFGNKYAFCQNSGLRFVRTAEEGRTDEKGLYCRSRRRRRRRQLFGWERAASHNTIGLLSENVYYLYNVIIIIIIIIKYMYECACLRARSPLMRAVAAARWPPLS